MRPLSAIEITCINDEKWDHLESLGDLNIIE